ncbi:penicillin-binding protein activator [Teredinibacter haidensis]|uniref:penicillin-binding protein activator n=1 Tax=Teredinibacter haidensis TaxID=2731755 RepID=UPI000AF85BB1|nr:penicillin-binding protein activator [Teredinibacter haidensis]
MTNCFTLLRHVGLLLLTALMLSACGSSQVKDEPSQDTSVLSSEQINAILSDASQAVGEERIVLMLEAADAMLQANELDWARQTLSELYPTALTDAHYFTYSLLSAQVALAEGEHFIAKRYLFERRLEEMLSTDARATLTARELRAALLCDLAEFRQCITERLQIDAILEQGMDTPPAEREPNQDLIWLALMELPLKDLQMEAQMQRDEIASGWYNLAALSKDNQTNMRLQLESVDNWVLRWPEHPASLRLPVDLQFLKQLVDEQPTQIAVLLPLSGKLAKASQAIRDGMMAAFYQLAESGDRLPDLRFYDTSSQDINQLYDQAVLEGAQLVIGPLDKENIDELTLRPELPVTTLALNYAENTGAPIEQLFQFGLAVEDEAAQVAERAWRDGHRSAMILAPTSSWGDRAASTFAARWEEIGGNLVGSYRFKGQDDYSNLIRSAMGVQDSDKRAQRLRQILGHALEFEPRPRKDIDLIFLVAHPTQARQIKPTLAYHYASNIPVYATSHIYNGDIDSNADRDMNGIRFATLPWFFNPQIPEKQHIDKLATGASAYQRLYALGVDAFHIYPRLQQLAQLRNAHFYGNTGKLRLDNQKRVVREQTWAQFIRGRAYATPTVAAGNAL